jgi:hypothetical protein
VIALQDFVNSLVSFLESRVTISLALAGVIKPNTVTELPAVTLSLSELQCSKVGVGGNPGNLETGSMQIALTVDLANPVVIFPDNEAVNLLSADRMSLQVPHQPLVDRNGSRPDFFEPEDLTVTLDGTGVSVVQTQPVDGQCRLNAINGILEFGAALSGTGTLVILYRIGQWETEITRCSGLLQVDVFANGAANTEQLSNEVLLALSGKSQNIMQGLARLSPVTWGAIEKPVAPKGETRLRTLGYSFTLDHEQPVISTGGGPIQIIDVWSAMGPEQFSITKRDNHE